MKKVKWEQAGTGMSYHARIGAIIMHVYTYRTKLNGKRWYAYVNASGLCRNNKQGRLRRSPLDAQKDAVELAREMLLDHHEALLQEMKRFDLIGTN